MRTLTFFILLGLALGLPMVLIQPAHGAGTELVGFIGPRNADFNPTDNDDEGGLRAFISACTEDAHPCSFAEILELGPAFFEEANFSRDHGYYIIDGFELNFGLGGDEGAGTFMLQAPRTGYFPEEPDYTNPYPMPPGALGGGQSTTYHIPSEAYCRNWTSSEAEYHAPVLKQNGLIDIERCDRLFAVPCCRQRFDIEFEYSTRKK